MGRDESVMAKAYGISYPILKSRLKYGYSLEEALTMPVDKRKTGRRVTDITEQRYTNA